MLCINLNHNETVEWGQWTVCYKIQSRCVFELSPYLCFISLLYLYLYVLGDDALMD